MLSTLKDEVIFPAVVMTQAVTVTHIFICSDRFFKLELELSLDYIDEVKACQRIFDRDCLFAAEGLNDSVLSDVMSESRSQDLEER